MTLSHKAIYLESKKGICYNYEEGMNVYESEEMDMEVSVKRDGIVLRGILEKPDLEQCPIVVMYHGFTGNLGYEEEELFYILAEKLKEKGIASIRFDFNGHGKSEGDFTQMNMLNELLDGEAILSYAEHLEFVTKVYVLGHSQGGVVGGMIAGYFHDRVDKLVLLAPAATLKDDAIMGTCMGVEYDADRIPDTVTLPNGYVVGGYYYRIAQTLPIFEVTACFKGRALVIHGKCDIIVAPESSERYESCMEQCSLVYYDSLDHGLEGKEKEEALQKVIEFLV